MTNLQTLLDEREISRGLALFARILDTKRWDDIGEVFAHDLHFNYGAGGEGLHWELSRDGVDVMCLVATLTDTPAMARSGIVLDADPQFTPMNPDAVVDGALANLGHTPLWFAAGGEVAQAIRATPRAALTEAMSRSSAKLWGIDI
jgi:hypothetical protein